MADSEEWFVGEDGCLSVGIATESVTYHSGLNTILLATKEPSVKILDVTSGAVLQNSDLSASKSSSIFCTFLQAKDRVLFCDNNAVSLRKDLNGVLLLDTALQTPVSKTDDNIKLELPLPEATHLFKSILSAELQGVEYVEEVIKEFEKEIDAVQQATKGNHKIAKWATVCVCLPHAALRSVCSALVAELKRLHQHVAGLSVAAAVTDRLQYLVAGGEGPGAAPMVDRALMYSEAARRDTFLRWPHMNYKWALPDPMAQAGFYHQPSSTGDDRAMCFTCNVCLVCWEPTDEPWSEHERHSPSCPFVKGEWTQNVPMSVTYATEPGRLHGGHIACVSTTSSDDFFATSTLHGNVVVWDMTRQLKKKLEFNIDPWEPVIAMKTGTPGRKDAHQATSWEQHNQPISIQIDPTANEVDSDEGLSPTGAPVGEVAAEEEGYDENDSKMEVVEVGGAWQQMTPTMTPTPSNTEVVDVPLDDVQPINIEPLKRCRPSQDVLVSALCVLGAPATEPRGAKPCLVAGVALRRAPAEQEEVQALNQVNQALSQAATIINPPADQPEPNPFVPYLTVHEIDVTRPRGAVELAAATTAQSNNLHVALGMANSHHNYAVPYSSSSSYQNYSDTFPPPSIDFEDGDLNVGSPSWSPSESMENVSGLKFGGSGIMFGNYSQLMPKNKQNKTSKSDDYSAGQGTSSNTSSAVPSYKDGKVLQCVALPPQVDSDQYVASITPTLDGAYIIVATAPKRLNRRLHLVSTNRTNDESTDSPTTDDVIDEGDDSAGGGGCLILYRVVTPPAAGGSVLLEERPVCVSAMDDPVTSVLCLPREVETSVFDEEDSVSVSAADPVVSSDSTATITESGAAGQLVVTTQRGDVRILAFPGEDEAFTNLARVPAPDADRFVSATYCIGMDRLCCATAAGKLVFFTVHPKEAAGVAAGSLAESAGLRQRVNSSKDDMTDGGENTLTDELLVHGPLSVSALTSLHSLTQFENLTPRFLATVPQCWVEVQQEQQQRRHPQHLQQHGAAGGAGGEAAQHTRTWRLQTDSGSWQEHLFELVLPRLCTVGHIDLKFSLHPLCTAPPHVQVTLLKQTPLAPAKTQHTDVDAKINFNLPAPATQTAGGVEFHLGSDDAKGREADTTATGCMSLDPATEIVAGPVDLASCVDMSGHGGVLTLTSPQLLRTKAKSFLLYFRAIDPTTGKPPDDADKTPEPSTSKDSQEKPKRSSAAAASGSKGMDGSGAAAAMSAMKQRLDNMKGCDWLQEISITIRKSKKAHVPKDRLQRLAMLDPVGSGAFHESLVALACGQEPVGAAADPQGGACEAATRHHRQKLALDILTWILAVTTNDTKKHRREGSERVLRLLQAALPALVRSCFLQRGRSIAHQAAKLIAGCLECAKLSVDAAVAPGFSLALLAALLQCLPHVAGARSAGALRWFFTLLNRVKVLDVVGSGAAMADVLGQVARKYSAGARQEHALLKARFGLYGTPLEPELFDLEPPSLPRSAGSGTSQTYARVVGANTTTAPSDTGAAPGQDEHDFRELLCGGGGGGPAAGGGRWWCDVVARHVASAGLLEVEPLSFTCHAASDGTRLERLSSGGSSQDSAGLLAGSLPGASESGLATGTINFGDSLSAAAGAALATLGQKDSLVQQQQHQLSLLQQKQLQYTELLKQKANLEQKLLENKAASAVSAAAGFGLSALSTMFPPPPPAPPKNTPFFMTPPLTPPNGESFVNHDPGKPPTGKPTASKPLSSKDSTPASAAPKWQAPASSNMFQPPPPQALVIERMHAGARRFVTLDFGCAVLLTDVLVPACGDLASLSLDLWVAAEDVDGTRLAVATDIGMRSLVLTNMMPPPVCRYLKITTIGKFGSNTTKTRIPIGSFYGHSYILPWELPAAADDSGSAAASAILAAQPPLLSQLGIYCSMQEDIQCRYSLAATRLQTLLSGLEPASAPSAHTEYFLKRGAGAGSARGQRTPEDDKLQQAYSDCVQLQLQFNLSQRAIERLQRAVGLAMDDDPSADLPATSAATLGSASQDALRVVAELLLDSLVSLTLPSAPSPSVPPALPAALPPGACEALFRHLCVGAGATRKMQLYTGVLLARLAGTAPWWGDFLANMLAEFFSHDQTIVFPQDRVFVLLVALGQKSLASGSSGGVLESLLAMLARLLAPVMTQHARTPQTAQLDISLVGWLLLFLSKCLDLAAPGSLDAADDKKDPGGGMSSRWDFIQGDAAMHNSRSSAKSTSARFYRRKLQKRLMHHKQHLLDLQAAKKNYMSTQLEKSGPGGVVTKEAESLMKQHEAIFKKQLKQYSSKHFKDLMNIRRTDGEYLKRLGGPPPPDADPDSAAEAAASAGAGGLVVARDRCLPVVRSLMALLLGMDFTCNVDLFIITCKVLARVCGLARPALTLAEVMTQEQLEGLVLLTVGLEHAPGPGGGAAGAAWANHAITCLLQDILDGEKLFPSSSSSVATDDGPGGVTDDEAVAAAIAAATAEEDSLLLEAAAAVPLPPPSIDADDSSSGTESQTGGLDLDTSESNNNTPSSSSGATVAAKLETKAQAKYKQMKQQQQFFCLLESTNPGELEQALENKMQEWTFGMKDALKEMKKMKGSSPMTSFGSSSLPPSWASPAAPYSDHMMTGYPQVVTISAHPPAPAAPSSGTKNVASASAPAYPQFHPYNLGPMMEEAAAGGKKGLLLESYRNRLNQAAAGSGAKGQCQGVSTAMDARLEFGVELNAEMRLRVLLTLEAVQLQTAITAPLPPGPDRHHDDGEMAAAGGASLDDDSAAGSFSSLAQPQASSSDMLSLCFTALFCQLPALHRVSPDALLLAWLTLNDDTFGEASSAAKTEGSFDPSRVPAIPLNQAALSALLASLAWAPAPVPVRTWVLAFHTLTLLANLKCSADAGASAGAFPGTDRWLASAMVADSNLMTVLVKFLSGSGGSGGQGSTHQVGPTATKAFQEFLVRLQLRCADDNEGHLKEMLLKLVYTLTAETGACATGAGPLDAQCRLLNHMVTDLTFDTAVDVTNAISVIESVTALVRRHLAGCGPALAVRSAAADTTISPRTCFGGMLAGLLRGTAAPADGAMDAGADQLMANLLKLVNELVQIRVPGSAGGATGSARTRIRANAAFSPSVAEVSTPDVVVSATTRDAVDSPLTDFSKISQSLASGIGMTSTPNVPPANPAADDPTGGSQQTDEQKTETAAAAANANTTNSPMSSTFSSTRNNNKVRGCTHYADCRWPENEVKEATLSDIILGHPHIMTHLLQALSCCDSNSVAGLLGAVPAGASVQDTLTVLDPLSVGDGVFHVLCTFNRRATDVRLVLRAVHSYLRGAGASSKLSEPLLWFVLRVLDCERAVKFFLEMGGVGVVCDNLVLSTRRLISPAPSLVSTIMSHLSAARPPAQRRAIDGASAPEPDGLQNFAPLGTISSSSPSAGPADVLIQSAPPHRRARSAAWSYHFYPDEAWVDLTIALPCAVLLREVHIQPHLTSLATCPGAVTLEVSRDCGGATTVPVCAPVSTMGLTCIKLTLVRPEVVSLVTVRLHKPRDSTTIGLSQITLNGYTAFSDGAAAQQASCLAPAPADDNANKTSVGWLRLLHHLLTLSPEPLGAAVAAAAAPTPNLLVTVTALLGPSAGAYSSHMEAVLLQLGLFSTHMGLALIGHLLRNTAPETTPGVAGAGAMYGRVGGAASAATVDLLYQLGTSGRGPAVTARAGALLAWLEDSARQALHRHHGNGRHDDHGGDWLPPAAPAHVHCVAAVLWTAAEQDAELDLRELVTTQLLSCLYEWSLLLAADSALKRAVDAVICSVCYVHPHYFLLLLQWLGVAASTAQFTGVIAGGITDDHKEGRQHAGPAAEPLTDDTKAASADSAAATTTTAAATATSHDWSDTVCAGRLLTLAAACQSPPALPHLLHSGFVALLCQALYEFCNRQMLVYTDHDADSAAGESEAEAAQTSSSARASPGAVFSLSAEQAASVLRFLAALCRGGGGGTEARLKDWLGGAGAVFWPGLLTLLCATPAPAARLLLAANNTMMTSSQRAAIENETVEFFTQVINCHPVNQHQFAQVLCDVIRGGGGGHMIDSPPPPLCGFLRRLFLQVLLEDERVVVTVRATAGATMSRSPAPRAGSQRHPRCGAGHRSRTLTVPVAGTTCGDIISMVSDSPSLGSCLLERGVDKRDADDRKDTSDLGLEVVDQISQAAGLSAQEKRGSGSGLPPPRPPSRRGHRPPDTAAQGPALHLSHSLLPNVPLASDLSLAQLLTTLYERGLEPGTCCLHFSMRLRTQKSTPYRATPTTSTDAAGSEPVPGSVTPLPSALQVFAGEGGLALLAEHLPLMYPAEVARSAPGPSEGGKDAGAGGQPGLGHDWVTVESSEDMYEEIYEPIPPAAPAASKPAAAAVTTSAGASVPPHSLVAFGLFLRLPGYAEVLLREKRRARCLLRLVLGVTDDGDGGHILSVGSSSSLASSLPTLPFCVLRSLYAGAPLTTDDGVLLRRTSLDAGVIHLLLACLSVLSHHAPRGGAVNTQQEASSSSKPGGQKPSGSKPPPPAPPGGPPASLLEDKAASYWAKGTGFGTGSTISSWDAEQALLRQRQEEQHVTCLLQVLASFIHPGGEVPADVGEEPAAGASGLPAALPDLLSQSCLVPAISSYLRNDSVLDMARHIPLYHALLLLLRGIAVCPALVPLLLPLTDSPDDAAGAGSVSIVALLEKIKTCVDTYASRLKTNKSAPSSSSKAGKSRPSQEEEESECLAQLIPDIQQTARIVHTATHRQLTANAHAERAVSGSSEGSDRGAARTDHSLEDRYMDVMREIQFDTCELVVDGGGGSLRFAAPHHYEANVKAAGDVSTPARARRLAQEAVTLSTSLPLSYNSSVFVRCDEDRLDVMKVLITGPSDTPYSNGCFEFDIYFPQDYPNSPPLVNLETTGNQTVRFNPNLYNDGKVCLSVLNTWHGRPEEKWNAQTSSFLQVLVSIQSLILVSEPYFNEPGYERSRGTPTGMASSREYDANIRQATVKWAMLEILKNPPPCFKEVIHKHFWLKKHEITMQIESWIADMESNTSDKRTGRTISHSLVALKRHYHQLKEEFAKMKPPSDLEDAADPAPVYPDPGSTPTSSTGGASTPLSDNASNSNSGAAPVATAAAEALAGATVEFALNAAVQSVLNHSGALDATPSDDTTSPDSLVSADSESGLVYVTQQHESKTDAQKTQEEMDMQDAAAAADLDLVQFV